MRPTHKLNAVFVMEQHLGHHTFYRNLRACLEAEPRIRPLWIEVTYTQPGSRWDSVPLLPSQWRGTLVGRAQVQKGLRQAAYDVAAALWRPGQDDVLAPYAERYVEALPTLHEGGMIPGLALTTALFPLYAIDEAWVGRARATAAASGPQT